MCTAAGDASRGGSFDADVSVGSDAVFCAVNRSRTWGLYPYLPRLFEADAEADSDSDPDFDFDFDGDPDG